MGETRLFVSNIPPNTTELELQNEFGFYGVVKKIDLKSKNDQSFGFVNIEIDEKLVDKCKSVLTQLNMNCLNYFFCRHS